MIRRALKWWPWIRFDRPLYGRPDYRWFWTPITERFDHGGWVYLSWPWLRRFWNGTHSAAAQDRRRTVR